MVLEGVVSILEGMNPRVIELKLRTFLSDQRVPDEELVKA
jgi:chemotaxis protein MotA